MSDSLDVITAASSEKTINGKKFVLRKLGLAGWGELLGWARDRLKGEAEEEMDLCKEAGAEDMRMARLKELLADLKGFDLQSVAAQRMIGTVEGVEKMIALSVVSVDGDDSPEIDMEDVADLEREIMVINKMGPDPTKNGKRPRGKRNPRTG